MAAVIGWHELIVLMAYGNGAEDSIRGEFQVREVDPPSDNFRSDHLREDDCGDDGGWFEDHATLGRVRVREQVLRAVRRGALVRLETADGRPRLIRGADATLVWVGEEPVPTAYDTSVSSFGWADGQLLYRLPASRWEGSDFTHLTGAIQAVEWLGRPAWAFELAPPGHKPYPIQLIVDAETGFVLSQANADLGSYVRWTSVEFGVAVDDALFEWDGPVRPASDRHAEDAAELARRAGWLAGRGVAASVAVPLALTAHEWDDSSGAFHADFYSTLSGSLLRRPHSGAPWTDPDSMNWPHHYRWSDERWDWFLGVQDELSPRQRDELRVQLARSN